jgi:hypothetical protein
MDKLDAGAAGPDGARIELMRLIDGSLTLRAAADELAATYWPSKRKVGAFDVADDGLSARFSIVDGSATYVVRFIQIRACGYESCAGVVIERVQP